MQSFLIVFSFSGFSFVIIFPLIPYIKDYNYIHIILFILFLIFHRFLFDDIIQHDNNNDHPSYVLDFVLRQVFIFVLRRY